MFQLSHFRSKKQEKLGCESLVLELSLSDCTESGAEVKKKKYITCKYGIYIAVLEQTDTNIFQKKEDNQ